VMAMDRNADAVRLTAVVQGEVQAVGFRWWVRSRALKLGLRGSASNLADGRVEVVVEGPTAACETLLDLLGEEPSRAGRPGRVRAVTPQWGPARGLPDGFTGR
jgi:acylphosphatase